MLRKNFIPASGDILFRSEDYHIENAERCERFRNIDTERMTPEELKTHNEKLAEAEIMQGKLPHRESSYDSAVYSCLKERINLTAPLLERHEREMMIKR